MNGTEAETDESGWNKENLLKLFSAMKKAISKNKRTLSYVHGMKHLKWEKVAFPPFSAEDCQRKWQEISDNIRKRRSLTELLNEAEEVIAKPSQNQNVPIIPGHPKKPVPPNILYFRKNRAKFSKKHPEMSRSMLMEYANKKYAAASEGKKAKYIEQHNTERETYNSKMQQYRMLYDLKSHRCRDKRDDDETPPPAPPCHGYSLFCTEQKSGCFAKGEFLKFCAKRWKDLKTSEKSIYNERWKELKEEYSTKLEAYLRRFNAEEREQIVEKYKIKLPKTHRKAPPRCGSLLFVQVHMERLKNEIGNAKDRFVKVNQMWRELPESEKKYYNKRASIQMCNYRSELQGRSKPLKRRGEEFQHQSSAKRKSIEIVEVASDSEDEYLDHSSSDEEQQQLLNLNQDEESEEDTKDAMFDMY